MLGALHKLRLVKILKELLQRKSKVSRDTKESVVE